MNNKKQFILLLIAILILTSVCGYIFGRYLPARKMKIQALDYLNGLYEDSFKPLRYQTSSSEEGEYESVTFSSEEFPDSVVEVRAYKNGNGTFHFKDNYYHCYMMDDVICYGETLIDNQDVAVKARFLDELWSDDIGYAKSFDEWRENGKAVVEIILITRSYLPSDIQSNIVNRVADDHILGSITFIETYDKNLLADKTFDEIFHNSCYGISSEKQYFLVSEFPMSK